MATGTLTGSTIAATYKSLLKVKGGANTILDGDIQIIEDGDGVDSVLGLSTDSALISGVGNKLYFYDADGGEHISADASGALSIAAETEIDLTATAVDLNGTLDVSGTLTVGEDGSGTDVIFYSGTAGDNFTWDASEECLIITGTDAAQALKVADGDLVVVDKIYLYDNDGGEYISGDGTDLTITSGNDIVLAVGSAGSVYSSGDGGTSNTIYGEDAGVALVSGGNYNVLFGYNAGAGITTGDENVVIGYSAGDSFDTESQNVLIGSGAGGNASFAANSCVAIGAGTLEGAATQDGSVAVGKNALNALTTGAQNVAVGYTALDELITGNFNTAIGHETLASADGSESGNTAVGAQSLYAMDADGTNANTAVGTESGFYNVTGINNTSVGYKAMKGASGQSNSNNTAVGKDALLAITTGGDNTAVGNSALLAVAGGARNTAIGQDAGKAVVSGNDNTFLGEGSGLACTGTSNVTVGCEAGDEITSGSYNIAIGYRSSVGTVDGDKQYIIGNSLTGTAVDAIFIGDGDDHVRCDWGTDATWDKVSDERKKNVSGDSPLGLEFINDLRSVSFTYKAPCDYPKEWTSYNADKKEPRTKDEQHGILAQDVKKALDNAGVDTFAGWSEDPDGCQRIGESAFVMPLIKAVQELSAKVEELEAKLK